MLLLTLLPLFTLFTALCSALPADTNAERLKRGLPLKSPATRVRRQNPTTSQGTTPGVNGVMQIARRQAPARRSLEEREAPSTGFASFDGTAFRWTASSAGAAVIRFPTDVGDQQPLRVNTANGLAYISIVNTSPGLYALRTTPEHDGVSTFTWTSVSSTSGGSNVGARVGNIFISFRLDANNDVLIGSSTFSSTPSQNPVWLFVSKAPVAISGPAALSAEVERMVTATNDFRAEYGAGALTYNPTIASFAQTVADTCVFEHSDGNGGMYGENLVYGGYSFDSVNAVNAWGPEEAVLYDFNNPGFSAATGHFTQLVWKATTEFGCAYKLCAPNTLGPQQNFEAMYIVCNYRVPGNSGGQAQYTQNVGPKVA